jgi:uncharacterized membrane protein (DUF4010 family)
MTVILSLAVALGIGLMIGTERERHKRLGAPRGSAGIRAFTGASLCGAIAFMAGGVAVLAVAVGAVTLLAALAYWRTRDDDPGLTTEIALVLTTLLGAFAVRQQAEAAAVAVIVAALLAARTPLHNFVRRVLTETELNDFLIFAGATLVVLPLLPNRPWGPYGALNLHAIWIVVVLVLAISAIGHVSVRLLGSRFGLPVSGLASGFISGLATIGAMGVSARKDPKTLSAAVAGTVLSIVATIIQKAAIVALTSEDTLRALLWPLGCAGIAAIVYGALFTAVALRDRGEHKHEPGQAFSLATALSFGLTLAVVLVVSAALRDRFGQTGAFVAAAVAGFVDAHAAAFSIASLVASGKMSAAAAVAPILGAFSANTLAR